MLCFDNTPVVALCAWPQLLQYWGQNTKSRDFRSQIVMKDTIWLRNILCIFFKGLARGYTVDYNISSTYMDANPPSINVYR